MSRAAPIPAGGHELRLYAHRGASAKLPENTLAAFQRGLEDGADALELDIHRTADGHFVVAHDPDGRRVAGEAAEIRRLTLAEVRGWRLQGAPPAPETRVPLLTEVLDAFPGVPMSIDLKPNDPSMVPPLLEELAAHDGERRVTLASFHDRLLPLVRRRGWRGRTALSRFEVAALRLLPAGLAARLIHADAVQIPRRTAGLRLDGRRFIAACRRLGLRLDYWVVNDAVEAEELLAAGATGLMSDDPAIVAEVYRRHHTTADHAR